MTRRAWLKSIAFLLVLGAVFLHLQGIFGIQDDRSHDNVRRFRRERPGTLDAVYLGGSDVHTYWQPAFGWADRGIAVWNYAVNDMPCDAIRFMIAEARKTQPGALYIVSLNTFKNAKREKSRETLSARIHRLADNMPLSLNKIRLVRCLCEGTELDPLEFFAPILRFHSRWDRLEGWNFGHSAYDHKASIHHPLFLTVSADIAGEFHPTDESVEPPEEVVSAFDALLDYCEGEGVDVLFVKVPQCADGEQMRRMNALERRALERGHPCLDAMEALSEYHLDLRRDFYNPLHLNVHGSLKYSAWLGARLAESRGFEDKRGRAGWEGWDAAARDYFEYVNPWTLPIERNHAPCDGSLDAPALAEPVVDGRGITLEWTPVEGAQFYAFFRKSGRMWQYLGEVDGAVTSWTHATPRPKVHYTYTVVPCRESGSGRVYGRFDHDGVSAARGS